MRFWRLSKAAYADRLDGGYGLKNAGRWNPIGNLVTYCASAPSLCLLESLVHIEVVADLPPYKLVEYEAPDSIAVTEIVAADLPEGWQTDYAVTQQLGADWYAGNAGALLKVPSAILPLVVPERNFIINHAHPEAPKIAIAAIHDFWFDHRL